MNYIIVQAGGKGSRLEHLTKNKPKALVPIENLPMLFHLFRKFPEKKFIIIADYKRNVLRDYLNAFADVSFQVVDAEGTGTCAGIRQAIDRIPDAQPFMLIWSDLILPRALQLPSEYEKTDGIKEDYIGISSTFPCRWSYGEGLFAEQTSCEHGVAGFFLFSDKQKLKEVPASGELVRWMQQKGLRFQELDLAGTREFGTLEKYAELSSEKCRPFNRITVTGSVLLKEPLDEQGHRLARLECRWYEKAQALHISGLPHIYSTDPLRMEYIQGKNIYEYALSRKEKSVVLRKLVGALDQLHSSCKLPSDSFSMKEAYFTKTMDRLAKIENLVPFSREKTVRVNGKLCRNVFFYQRELEKRLEELSCSRFCFIHGDCTFSNLMLRSDGSPVLIDPRGYFGSTELYGDARYDWAKLYYSIVGNYDRFNLKDFRLQIGDSEVDLEIASNGWEDMEEEFFSLTGSDPDEIKLLHAIIWLSLTTYAWQDFDSICGAFYNGLYYLEDAL